MAETMPELLTQNKQQYVGAPPPPTPAQVSMRMSTAVRRLVAEMFADMRDTIKRLPWAELQPVEVRQTVELGDAAPVSFTELAALAFDDLTRRWQVIFNNESSAISESMTQGALSASDKFMGKSMKELGKEMQLAPSDALQARIDASAHEAAGLIKRVPAEQIQQVQGDVMRSITQGEGLKDLIPALREREVKVKNWARNVALDQTRKTYSTINRTRAQEVGVRKFRWIHSGGSNDPRKYHMQHYPAGLNGGVFDFDDPPVIDQRTGETGYPAQAPYCGCIMQFVLDATSEE